MNQIDIDLAYGKFDIFSKFFQSEGNLLLLEELLNDFVYMDMPKINIQF